MSKYRHIITGLIILSIYFIHSFIINSAIAHSIRHSLDVMNAQQIVDFITLHPTVESQNIYYYKMVFFGMFVVYTITALIIVIVHHKKIINKLKYNFNHRRFIIKRFFIYIGVLFSFTIIAYLINILLFSDLASEVGANQSVINLVLLDSFDPYTVIVVVLLSPIIEEYIFRYGLINNLLKKRHRMTQVVVSSFIFSFIHIGVSQMLISPAYFGHLLLLYLPMSLVYSYVYVKERNIAYPLGLHILNNIGSIIVIYLFN